MDKFAEKFSLKDKSPEEKTKAVNRWLLASAALLAVLAVALAFIMNNGLMFALIIPAVILAIFAGINSASSKFSETTSDDSEKAWLADGEEVLFELNIEEPTRDDEGDAVAAVLNIFHAITSLFSIFSCCSKKSASAVLYITNMRCVVATLPDKCSFLGIGKNEKFFWSFPREALNGNNSFKFSSSLLCCCGCSSASLSLGLSVGKGTDFSISFTTNDIHTVGQAEKVLAKFHQLSQQTR